MTRREDQLQALIRRAYQKFLLLGCILFYVLSYYISLFLFLSLLLWTRFDLIQLLSTAD